MPASLIKGFDEQGSKIKESGDCRVHEVFLFSRGQKIPHLGKSPPDKNKLDHSIITRAFVCLSGLPTVVRPDSENLSHKVAKPNATI
jgi:hypothetical protein